MLSKEEILNKTFQEDAGMSFLELLGAHEDAEMIQYSLLASMEQYATQKAIAFAEWISGEGYREYDGYDRWIAPNNSNDVYETKQLYKIFLKQ